MMSGRFLPVIVILLLILIGLTLQEWDRIPSIIRIVFRGTSVIRSSNNTEVTSLGGLFSSSELSELENSNRVTQAQIPDKTLAQFRFYSNTSRRIILCLTIDDYDSTDIYEAFDVANDLVKRNLTSTFFIIPHKHRPLSELSGGIHNNLTAMESAGMEFALHGYYHTHPPEINEFEFQSLNRSETIGRVQNGLMILQDIGLHIRGFRAPGLMTNEHLYDALVEAGFEYESSVADPVNPVPRRVGGLTVLPIVEYGVLFHNCKTFNRTQVSSIDDKLWNDLVHVSSRGGVYTILIHSYEIRDCNAMEHIYRLVDRAQVEDYFVESVTLSEVLDRYNGMVERTEECQ